MELKFLFFGMFGECSSDADCRFNPSRFELIEGVFSDGFLFDHARDRPGTVSEGDEHDLA